MKGYDYRQYNLLSLAGIYSPNKEKELVKVPVALVNYLQEHPNTKRIAIHFDNDAKGREAAIALKTGFKMIIRLPCYLRRKARISTTFYVCN